MKNFDDNSVSPSLILIKYGVIGAVLSFILTIITQYSGLQEEFSETLGWVSFLSTLIINISLLFFALREIRSNNGEFISYGQGLGNATLLGSIMGVMSGGFNYIYLNFIDTGVVEKQMNLAREKLEDQGLSSSQIEEAEKVTKLMMGPGVQFMIIVLMSTLFLFLLGLIVSAVVKREKSIFDE